MKLTYKIVYNPLMDLRISALDRNISFVCSDNKVHVRLRDYDHPEVISGFINKLTYLVTYLFQRSIDISIDDFISKDDSFKALNDWLKANFIAAGKKYKGLKISKNYRRISKEKANPLGSFEIGTCPLKNDITYGDLDFFHCSLIGLGIENFLFNDAIELHITKVKHIDSYKKFHNKELKKVKKETLEYIPLF